MSYSVVWFKRDLRVVDHGPLYHASQRGPVLCLYIIEPSFWAEPDAAHQHYAFLIESLRDLYRALRKLGARLHVVTGEVIPTLQRLHQQAPFSHLYSHEETGNGLTYRRDVAVGTWCRQHAVTWHEIPQFGVVRRLRSRDDWQSRWEDFMLEPCLPAPERVQAVALPWEAGPPPTAMALGLEAHLPPGRQHGGRSLALPLLQTFLQERSRQYRGGISSPLSAPTACSRLSPYLALGCIGLREVVQVTQSHIADVTAHDPRHAAGLAAFISRLYWHCHFIQKLESEPALEFENLNPEYNGLREPEFNDAHFQALTAARTGWPLVDACVVMLRETGWINFRMRAMLVSVAAYPLWLHWRPVGLWLARHFLDYEPGIHWSQLQMQSGTTGINLTRIYNPVKQARDHDPHGHFVRRWLPALRHVPDSWLFEPWRMPSALKQSLGLTEAELPTPLVDLESATRIAKQRLHAVRQRPEHARQNAGILDKHGSRKGRSRARQDTRSSRRRGSVRPASSDQLSLGF